MVVVCLVVSYIYILRDHNTKALLPDVLREEFTSAVLPSWLIIFNPIYIIEQKAYPVSKSFLPKYKISERTKEGT